MAWLTTNTMKAKRALGAGLKKKPTSYTDYPVNMDESEKAAVLSAVERKKPVNVTINLLRTRESIINDCSLPLTLYQIKKLKKARKENKTSMKLTLSVKQLENFKKGGFLPALVATAPAIASVLGTIYNSYQNKKANDQLTEEKIRHNRASEGKGLYMNKKPKVLTGEGLRNKKKKQKATGLYMNKKPKALTGQGLRKQKVTRGGNPLLRELMIKKKILR